MFFWSLVEFFIEWGVQLVILKWKNFKNNEGRRGGESGKYHYVLKTV